MDAHLPAAVRQATDRECIVKVFGVFGVDREGCHLAEVLTLGQILRRNLTWDAPRSFLDIFRITRWQTVLSQDGVHFRVVIPRATEHLDDFARRIRRVFGPLGDTHDSFIARATALKRCFGDKDVVGERAIFGHKEGVVLGNLQPTHIGVCRTLQDLHHLRLRLAPTTFEELHTYTIAIERVGRVAIVHIDGFWRRCVTIGIVRSGSVRNKGMSAIATAPKDSGNGLANTIQAITPRFGLREHIIVRQTAQYFGRLELLHLCFDADSLGDLLVVINRARIELERIQDGPCESVFFEDALAVMGGLGGFFLLVASRVPVVSSTLLARRRGLLFTCNLHSAYLFSCPK